MENQEQDNAAATEDVDQTVVETAAKPERVCCHCRHFMRHKTVVRGPFWGDDLMEVDDVGGDCRANPPRAGLFGGRAVFPYVLTGQSCSWWQPVETES